MRPTGRVVCPVVSCSPAGLRDVLARVVEANERWERLAGQLRAENVELRAENERLRAGVERLSAELAVLQRLVFGRSSERVRPSSMAGDDDDGDGQGGHGGEPGGRQREKVSPRGPGGRVGGRDYSHLPRVEVFWDLAEGGTAARVVRRRSRRSTITPPSRLTGG